MWQLVENKRAKHGHKYFIRFCVVDNCSNMTKPIRSNHREKHSGMCEKHVNEKRAQNIKGALGKKIKSMEYEVDKYKEQNQQLKKALEFYADQSHYETDYCYIEGDITPILVDDGEVARKALEE